MKRLMWITLALTACGEDTMDLNGDGQGDQPGSVTQIAPVHPIASVSGYIYDLSTGQAIPSASVTLHARSSETSTTGSDGYVQFKRVAAGGDALFHVAVEGYLPANGAFHIPSSSGDFPSANNHATFGRVGLMRSTALTTTVYGEDLLGKAAVRMSISIPYTFVHDGSERGEMTLQSVSDDDGTVRFEAAPDLTALSAVIAQLGGTVGIHSHADESGPGVTVQQDYAELASLGRLPLFVRHAGQLMHTLVMGPNLRMVHSNTPDLVERRHQIKVIPVTTPIRLLFDRAVDPATLQVVMVTETGASEVEMDADFSAGGRLITLAPALGGLTPGAEYNLSVNARSLGSTQAWVGNANLLTQSDHVAPFGDEDYVVEWDDRNDDGEINGGDDLFLNADLPIGRRSLNGASGLSSALAQFAFVAALDAENSVLGEIDYEENGVLTYPAAVFMEPDAGYGIYGSGYTSRLRLRLPSAAVFNANMGISVRIKMIFDNPALLNSNNQVKMPDGTNLTNYTIRLALP